MHLKEMFRLLVMLQIVSTAFCSTVTFQDCGSAYDLEEVHIEGCSRTMPCFITQGQATPVTVNFYADFASLDLDQKVVININFIDLATEVTPEPCEITGCPVPTGCETSFTSVMSVPKNIALNSRGWLRWQVFNERGILVLCYSVLVQTQSRVQKLLRNNLVTALSANSTMGHATIDFSEIDFNSLQLDNESQESSYDSMKTV